MTVEHHSFLIRIWRDAFSNLSPHGEWHGEVEHIQSGSRWTFEQVEKYLSLIKFDEHGIEMIENFDNKAGSNAFAQSLQNPGKGRN